MHGLHMRAIPLHPLFLLVAFAAVLTGCLIAYFVSGRPVPADFLRLAGFSWGWLALAWLSADSRRLRARPCFDLGLFCVAGFPLSLPCYCFWSRGWRGIGVLVSILGLWIGPQFIARLWLALSGRA